MSKLDELTIGVSPLTNTIYAGYTSKNDPRRFTSKVDVTDQVLNAVVAHMKIASEHDEKFGGYGFSSGVLQWVPKSEEDE